MSNEVEAQRMKRLRSVFEMPPIGLMSALLHCGRSWSQYHLIRNAGDVSGVVLGVRLQNSGHSPRKGEYPYIVLCQVAALWEIWSQYYLIRNHWYAGTRLMPQKF
jgi:hypothetical protein